MLNDKYLAADGIENVIKVLDEIEKENFSGLEFIELNSCNGGCVGGALNVENPYIARARLHIMRRYLPVTKTRLEGKNTDSMLWDASVEYNPVLKLDSNRGEAMRKMQMIEEIYDRLPQLGCGSCGSPTCREFAEDIVRGKAQERDCIFRLREKIEMLAKEITELSKMINE